MKIPREVWRTVRASLDSWSQTARLCVLTTVLVIDGAGLHWALGH